MTLTQHEAVARLLKWLPKRAYLSKEYNRNPEQAKTIQDIWFCIKSGYCQWSNIYNFHFSTTLCWGRVFKARPCICITVRDDGLCEWREHLPYQGGH